LTKETQGEFRHLLQNLQVLGSGATLQPTYLAVWYFSRVVHLQLSKKRKVTTGSIFWQLFNLISGRERDQRDPLYTKYKLSPILQGLTWPFPQPKRLRLRPEKEQFARQHLRRLILDNFIKQLIRHNFQIFGQKQQSIKKIKALEKAH